MSSFVSTTVAVPRGWFFGMAVLAAALAFAAPAYSQTCAGARSAACNGSLAAACSGQRAPRSACTGVARASGCHGTVRMSAVVVVPVQAAPRPQQAPKAKAGNCGCAVTGVCSCGTACQCDGGQKAVPQAPETPETALLVLTAHKDRHGPIAKLRERRAQKHSNRQDSREAGQPIRAVLGVPPK